LTLEIGKYTKVVSILILGDHTSITCIIWNPVDIVDSISSISVSVDLAKKINVVCRGQKARECFDVDIFGLLGKGGTFQEVAIGDAGGELLDTGVVETIEEILDWLEARTFDHCDTQRRAITGSDINVSSKGGVSWHWTE